MFRTRNKIADCSLQGTKRQIVPSMEQNTELFLTRNNLALLSPTLISIKCIGVMQPCLQMAEVDGGFHAYSH